MNVWCEFQFKRKKTVDILTEIILTFTNFVLIILKLTKDLNFLAVSCFLY